MISVNILLRECYRNIGKIDKIDEIEPSNILNLLNILNLSPSDKHGEIGGKAAKDNRPSALGIHAATSPEHCIDSPVRPPYGRPGVSCFQTGLEWALSPILLQLIGI
jgi:hypothetical protein